MSDVVERGMMRARPHAEWKEGWHAKREWVPPSSVYFLSVTSGTNVSLHSFTYNHNRTWQTIRHSLPSRVV